MSRKLVILTEIIAPYRIPVFNALAVQPGVDLHVMFLAETDEGLRQWSIYKNEIKFSHQVLPSWRWRAGKSNILVNRRVFSALGKENPQVIICGGYNYATSWLGLWWAKRHKAEFVLWSESNGRDARSGARRVESLKMFFLRHCDRFVVPGKASFEYLKSLGCPATAIWTAPNAVDNDLFASRAGTARSQAAQIKEKRGLPARFILFVGRLVPEKGIFDLLAAYARLESDLRSAVGLVFAGDGISREELTGRAKDINPGNICFPGFAQREELADLYALAEALVLPTHSDTWGLVVNEAMACGLPVVVSDVAGCVSDLVQDGWNGYVVPAKDAEKLSVAMNALLTKPELRQQMGARSFDQIRKYSPQACASGLAAVALSETVGAQ